MGKTLQGQHIKRDRGFQQRITHCKKKSVERVLWACSLENDGDEEDDDVKNQHILFFLIQQATTMGRKGKTSTIHVITTHNKQWQWGTREHINDAHKTMHNKQWWRCFWACLPKEEGDKEPNEELQLTKEFLNLLLAQQFFFEKNKKERNNEEGEK